MKTLLKVRRQFRKRGIAILAALVFVAVFSALSVGILSLSTSNVRIADNHHKSNLARSCAESGLDYVRYWMKGISIPGSLAVGARFNYLIGELETNLSSNNVYYRNLIDTAGTFTIGTQDHPITLNENLGQAFYATMDSLGANGVRVRVTGKAGDFERTIEGVFSYGVRQRTVFDYGVATKGPLTLSGNVQLEGVNISVESDVYIESIGINQALSVIGKSQIAGDVKIVNPSAYVILQGGQAGIGGETGQAAIDNHVQVGVPATDFPFPDAGYFERYVDGITITSSNVSGGTYENIRIAANANPTFNGNVVLKGVVFIEYPNQVTFAGNADITGIIVGDGDLNDNSGTSKIDFKGTVSSTSVAELPVEQYGDLTTETGTFLMAPGFSAFFGGNFDTLNGCIAANGVQFYGNAGGIIGGSVINYSPMPMNLSGNSDLYFNRSGITDIPAGFMPEVVIHYLPESYNEIH
jgi:hypothetical protein